MVVELISDTGRAQQNTLIHLTKSKIYKSTKKLKSCHGRWYYEAAHIESDSNYHLIGFSMNLG